MVDLPNVASIDFRLGSFWDMTGFLLFFEETMRRFQGVG